MRALDAGESARFSGVFPASAFFSLDGVPPSAPAQVTRTVRWNAVSFYKDARKLSVAEGRVPPTRLAVQVACGVFVSKVFLLVESWRHITRLFSVELSCFSADLAREEGSREAGRVSL